MGFLRRSLNYTINQRGGGIIWLGIWIACVIRTRMNLRRECERGERNSEMGGWMDGGHPVSRENVVILIRVLLYLLTLPYLTLPISLISDLVWCTYALRRCLSASLLMKRIFETNVVTRERITQVCVGDEI
ncbi:uncharacterized protein F4817DRAFT_102336 [Daldinia loculata]|uniref:uncharacterized protein n=1 Tax=Daldinia loculata TaxID=103429 RepID=UPI0020C295F6|nr:uncharacterized protein F4817DRAFT_102336 [Daldinia loculata]KAI1647544.1 hypothetical protein F4817DRAFT_102336 [Daldinia loculata]